MSIVRIHISVRQMCVMCVELWRVEESSFPSTPHSLPSQAVLAAVMYYKPVIYITCSFVLLLTFCQSVAHFWHSITKSQTKYNSYTGQEILVWSTKVLKSTIT